MINNTSIQRWQRASARNLDARFINEITQGMDCSAFEAEAIRDKVHEVYTPLMETADTLKPGQLRMAVIDAGVVPNTPLAKAQQRLVSLTLDAGNEDRAVRERGGVIALRRHRLLRRCAPPSKTWGGHLPTAASSWESGWPDKNTPILPAPPAIV